MRRTQRLLALVLALLAPCFGVAFAEDGDDKKTPAPVENHYVIDDVHYYNVYMQNPEDAKNFDLPEKFLPDMINGGVLYKYGHTGTGIGDRWTELAGRIKVQSEGAPTGMDAEILGELMFAGARNVHEHVWNLEKTHGSKYRVLSSLPKYGNSFGSAVGKICQLYKKNGWPGASNMENYIQTYVIQNEEWSKPREVVAIMESADYGGGGAVGALVLFTDFRAIPMLPDSEKPNAYIRIREEPKTSTKTVASNVKNLTAASVIASQTVSNSWSTTVSSEIGGSSKYSMSSTLELGSTIDLLVAEISSKVSITVAAAVEKSWKERKSSTEGEDVSHTVSVALPPYTNVILEQGSSETNATTHYNCPVGMEYTVYMYVWNTSNDYTHNTDDKSAYTTFGPDARADLYKRAYRLASDEYPEGGKMGVKWTNLLNDFDCRTDLLDYLAYCVPMSPVGAAFNENLSTASITVKDIVPTLPLRVVKLEAPNVSFVNDQPISYGKFNYMHADMNVGDSSYTTLLQLKGLNKLGVDFYSFNPRWGEWKVVDKDGKELTGDDAPVKLELLDDVSKNWRFTAVKPGTCFLKYFINEESYREDAIAYAEDPDKYDLTKDSDEEGKGWTTNDKLEATAALEITVVENHTIEVTGSYTGEVHKAAEKLEENGLSVSLCLADGKELDEKYTWEAKELPAKGISLNADGTVKFDKPGTFHVRAVCEAHSIKSDWVEITAAEKGLARIVTPPTPRDGLYDGQEQALLIPGEVEGGTMVYCLDTDGTNETFTEVGKVFSADVPTASQAGTYKIWYKALGDANHIDSQVSYVIVTVLKSPVQPVKPDSEALVYNGKAQVLVQAGTVAGGTLQYFVGDKAPEKEEGWSAEMPTGTDAGEYTVWYRVKGDKNHNDSEPASLKVTIEKRPLLVTPNDAAKTFGDADPVLTWTADGLVGSDSLLGKLERTKGENVGTYAITQGTLAASDNYALTFNEGLFTVKPKAITVKAKDATAVYGNADPEFKYTVTGLMGEDKLTGRLSREDGVDVGKYPITQGTLEAPGNYTISFEDAVFTITKRPVTVKAKATSKRYGDADPELEYTIKGLVEPGQLTGKLVRKAGEKVGAYAIGKGSLSVGKNYKLTFKGAKFTVKPRTVTVTAKDVSKVAGSADPKLTYTVDGLVNGDKLKGKLIREVGEAPGSYAITQGTLRASKNYAISFNGASLTITAREKLPVAPDYTLLARMVSENDSTIFLSWSKVDGAVGYDVFFKDCDGDQDYSLTKTVMGMNCRLEGLKKGSCHKGFVRAWTNKNGNKAYIGNASPTVHCIVGGSDKEHTNAKSVKLNKTSLTLVKGGTSNLKASAKGEVSGKKALDHIRAIRFYSSNANVAKVNRYGKITAVEGGVCTIYAMANDGVRASVKVKVVASPEKVSFAKSSYSVKRGKTLKLAKQVRLSPAGLQSALGWTSSDPTIATVSANGVVKGVKKGSVTITAVADNGKKGTVTVKVK